MTEPRAHRHIVRNGKKGSVPLSKLRTSDAVKTVVDHPRRLEELMRMLEDKDRCVRDRASAALARLAESHPARLLRIVSRIQEAIVDDSANVRWHLAYALGKLGENYPAQSSGFMNDLIARLEDQNRIVRRVACKSLIQVAVRKPAIIEESFQNLKKEIPISITRILRKTRP